MRDSRNEFTDASTVQETIAEASNTTSLTYYNTSILETIEGSNIEYSTHNIIYDYLDEMLALCETVQLTDLQYIKYEFRPDLLSYDVYGTIDYDFVILALNDMLSAKEFTKKKLKMLSRDYMTTIMNKIYNAEQSYIEKNRATYSA
jgi:hypothetical protein